MCEDLGLDPTAYRITCIPFDVYKRLADRYGWGTRPLWTHFDGYQVTRDGFYLPPHPEGQLSDGEREELIAGLVATFGEEADHRHDR